MVCHRIQHSLYNIMPPCKMCDICSLNPRNIKTMATHLHVDTMWYDKLCNAVLYQSTLSLTFYFVSSCFLPCSHRPFTNYVHWAHYLCLTSCRWHDFNGVYGMLEYVVCERILYFYSFVRMNVETAVDCNKLQNHISCIM